MPLVKNNSALLVHLILELEDGSVAESSRSSGKPFRLQLGDQSLSSEFEAQLLGLQVGDKRRFTLLPEHAFGNSNPDLVQFFSRRDFVQTGVPDAGTIMLFTAMDGSEMAGIIREVACESITVDFNHPLAGQSVTFDIEVLSVDPSLAEIEKSHAYIVS